MNTDELVAEWAFQRFRERALKQYETYVVDHPWAKSIRERHPTWAKQLEEARHIALCKEHTVAVHPEHGWECGCYSEYTRDDTWYWSGLVSCPHHFAPFRTTASEWDKGLPGVIQELIRIDGEDFTCAYDEDDG